MALVLQFSQHALSKLVERRIPPGDVRRVLEANDVIEDYPDDTPYPSALYLGFAAQRALHVVAARVPGGDQLIVITLYEPAPERWDATFRGRT